MEMKCLLYADHGQTCGPFGKFCFLLDIPSFKFTGNISVDAKNKPPTVKILKFGTPQTIAITVLKIEKFDVTLH